MRGRSEAVGCEVMVAAGRRHTVFFEISRVRMPLSEDVKALYTGWLLTVETPKPHGAGYPGRHVEICGVLSCSAKSRYLSRRCFQ